MAKPLETIEIETAPKPRSAVIWLHGLGADGNDFVPVVPELGLQGKAVRFVFPHAPMQAVTINAGMIMRAWYDIADAAIRREDAAGIEASRGHVETLIAREQGRGIPESQIVLAGFSQGGAIALHTGLRHQGRLAGILALSSYLPLAERLPGEASPLSRSVPIFMGHGVSDPIVPFARAVESRDFLQQLGYPLEWHQYPMAHSVCLEEISDIAAWLAARV